jgi:NADH-quinone oxidoreductase subunit L
MFNSQFIQASLWLIPVCPLVGAAFNALLGRRFSPRLIHFIGCTSICLSFLLTAAGGFALIGIKEPQQRLLIQTLYQWMQTSWPAGQFSLEVAFRLDPLSAVLALVVTGVGFLIHLYSVGYMAGDPSQARYFAYLNLFTFSMLVLVLADNLLLLFVGWEGVGLCSYLLIGFWFTDLEKARAGMKAFIVNRVGDFGFFVGLMLLFWSLFEAGDSQLSGLSFIQLKEAAPLLGTGTATWVSLLFFMGAAGKSAQIPLYIWLPDAMAGPTPVSAFIHAATMVTAGVYMIARLNFLYLAAPAALAVVAVVGGLTAFYAATMAVVQNDIKRVLAYSTISQLGYMFLAVGMAAFGAAIFHLVTHAFFKALLFLGAGSVIHAVHHNDMQAMGGLKKYMPLTYGTFLIAYLAISGIPPFSGFFSKDAILAATLTGHLPLPWMAPALFVLGLVTAGLTAFYMTRMMVLTFAGRFRGAKEQGVHLHESPPAMIRPLLVLGGLAALGGIIGLPELTHFPNLLQEFLSPVFAIHATPEHAAQAHTVGLEIALMTLSMAVAVAGIVLGIVFYAKRPQLPGKMADRFGRLYRLLMHKYYVDELYQYLFVRPLLRLVNISGRFDLQGIDAAVNLSSRLTAGLSFWVGWEDLKVVDGAINGLSALVQKWADRLRRLQTGQVQHYLYSAAIGTCILFLLLVFI